MTTTKFRIRLLNQYLFEIFGNKDFNDALINKNISQKVKFHLKKLGNSLDQEYKDVVKQIQELYDKYSEEIPLNENENLAKGQKPKRRIKEEFKEQFLKGTQELEDMEISIQHEPFVEKDFIDRNTGDVVGGSIYYNIIDTLLWERAEEDTK